MRILLSVAVLLFGLSSSAAAGSLSIGFLNSNLSFGGLEPVYHSGYDLYRFEGHPASERINDLYGWYTTWEASTGAGLAQTLIHDGAGNITGSEYLYLGGVFRMDLRLMDPNGRIHTGMFTAAITSLVIDVDDRYRGVSALYELGRGHFDRATARLLGIGARVPYGDIWTDMILNDDSDYTSPAREAWDGVAEMDFATVPEPPTAILGLVGAGSLWIRRRREARQRPEVSPQRGALE